MSQNLNIAQNVSIFKKIFLIGIVANLAYLLIEAIFGLYIHSSGLLSDAIQNLCDVAGMTIVLSAFKLADPGGTYRFNYKYKKTIMVMVALVTLAVGITTTYIILSSIQQFQTHAYIEGKWVAIIAGIGVLVNTATATLFLRYYQRKSKKGKAFRHMVADALVSLAVMCSGILMVFNRWYLIDALIGLAVILVTVFALWELQRHCIWTILDGVPDNIQYENLVHAFYEVDGIADIHHLHVWSVGAAKNALTAKVLVHNMKDTDTIRLMLNERLAKEGISDITLEFESES